MSAQYLPRHYLGVGIIQLSIMMIFCLVFLMDVIKLVLVLGSPVMSPKCLVV